MSRMLAIKEHITNSITIACFNVLNALKNIKCGTPGSTDGISTEHFVFLFMSIPTRPSAARNAMKQAGRSRGG